jgi:hypothetical protein
VQQLDSRVGRCLQEFLGDEVQKGRPLQSHTSSYDATPPMLPLTNSR